MSVTEVLAPVTTTTRLAIPRAGTLEFTRDRATGALVSIDGGGRNYLHVEPDGAWQWEAVCSVREARHGDSLVRLVQTRHERWEEHYRWQGDTLTEVDGVTIRRDDHGRVVACLPSPARGDGSEPAPADHRWLYSYGAEGPNHIAGPFGSRTVSTSADGVVRSARQQGIVEEYRHDTFGCRVAPRRPSGDHVDPAGRCWASIEGGAVRHVFMWDGSRCLARVDGTVGDAARRPCSASTRRPHRCGSSTPTGTARVPRDAYGEGLLAHRGVPGLFGGADPRAGSSTSRCAGSIPARAASASQTRATVATPTRGVSAASRARCRWNRRRGRPTRCAAATRSVAPTRPAECQPG